MDFWVRAERTFRIVFMGKDWRVSVENPAGLLDFRAKDLTAREIQDKVDENFDSGSFPVKVKISTHQGDRFNLQRIAMLDDNQVCTGQISVKGQRFLTFDLTS
ncbi:MAG: hypothetical protein AAGB32_00035 [Pseudomonadota bacterium]